MRVALIAGPCQPGQCGVGDYTTRLAEALRETGLQAEVVKEGNWDLTHARSIIPMLRRIDADVFHIQYPTVGFGRKLGPQALAMLQKSIVTIHEFNHAHVLRKIALYPLFLRARHVIFTTEIERRFALRWAPWIEKSSSVIPIGSNIERVMPVRDRNICEIIYFGLIMPRKGLEAVLELATLLKEKRPGLVIRIVGNPHPDHWAYLNMLQRSSKGLPIVWEQGLNEQAVAKRLAGSWIAYLPYPDGASERRASLKAALASGMNVITTEGPETPINLGPVVKMAASPRDALAVILALASNAEERLRLQSEAQSYTQRFSWHRIATLHYEVYVQVTSRAGGGGKKAGKSHCGRNLPSS